ncbi:MAG: radical SAM protein [Desulfocapsaceae bacterium]|nr:radical SAM protein [Desulfocapsaceae bacterium]
MTELSIQYLVSGGVITNYNCPSRCGHCLYNCGPHRSKDYLDADTAKDIFRCIADLGCRSVHIGGGEPLLDVEKLLEVLEVADNIGVAIDYVETNSSWFKDQHHAASLLNRLLAVGVDTLLVSISPFHNAHIPYSRVQGVLDACQSSGMQVFPWKSDFIPDIRAMDENQTHSMADFEKAFGPNYLQSTLERYWIHLGGRALTTMAHAYPLYSVEEIMEKSPANCANSLADTSHFHIDLYGKYIPGLCAGLVIDMNDLGRPLSPGKYPLLEQLTAGGINELHNLASNEFGFSPQKKDYLNHCELCTEIRCFLINDSKLQFRELNPGGFYAEFAR